MFVYFLSFRGVIICIPGASLVAHSPVVQKMQVRSLGQEDPLEEDVATHCSILTWVIAWTDEPGGLHSMGSKRVGHDSACMHAHRHTFYIPYNHLLYSLHSVLSGIFTELCHCHHWCRWGFFGYVCGILVPRVGFEPTPSTLEVQCPNRWATREVPKTFMIFLTVPGVLCVLSPVTSL